MAERPWKFESSRPHHLSLTGQPRYWLRDAEQATVLLSDFPKLVSNEEPLKAFAPGRSRRSLGQSIFAHSPGGAAGEQVAGVQQGQKGERRREAGTAQLEEAPPILEPRSRSTSQGARYFDAEQSGGGQQLGAHRVTGIARAKEPVELIPLRAGELAGERLDVEQVTQVDPAAQIVPALQLVMQQEDSGAGDGRRQRYDAAFQVQQGSILREIIEAIEERVDTAIFRMKIYGRRILRAEKNGGYTRFEIGSFQMIADAAKLIDHGMKAACGNHEINVGQHACRTPFRRRMGEPGGPFQQEG